MIFEEFDFYRENRGLGIGDWGLGIGDWANPQSPIHFLYKIKLNTLIYKAKIHIFIMQ